jgi:uncharacterized membrane protein
VTAASATSLVDADGTLIDRYLPVRWTVRLLSLCSTLHVLVGIMLVSAAILVLDPNSSEPGAGLDGGRFSIRSGRAAGAYSLVVCGAAVIVTFVVQRRYSRRTWFV